jgi:hypothetical protein
MVKGVKRAILIGSTYHSNGEKSELEGVFTDIITRRNNLIDSFGYKSEDIIILTDQYMLYYPDFFEDYTENYKTIMIQGSKVMYSSKVNIFYIIEKMIKLSNPDDELFIQFAGHGIQLSYNPWSNETDNKDEVYLALNSKQKIEHISDNELNLLINPTPCKTIVIFDNCHSATIMDAPKVIYFDIKKNKLIMRNENKDKSFNKNIIVISGARDKDWSYDGTNFRSLQRTGIFTQSLIESQRKILVSKNRINLGNLLKESTEWLYKYHNNTNRQLPHVSGNFDSIEEVEDYEIYSQNNYDVQKRELVVESKKPHTKKILINLLNNLLDKYFK